MSEQPENNFEEISPEQPVDREPAVPQQRMEGPQQGRPQPSPSESVPHPSRRQRKKRGAFQVFGVVIGLLVGLSLAAFAAIGVMTTLNLLPSQNMPAPMPSAADPSSLPQNVNPDYPGMELNSKPQAAPSDGEFTTEQAVEKASPSVVTIQVTANLMGVTYHGLGSGVVIDEEGYIITNAHVVEYARNIKVILNGEEEELPATLVGIDRRTDLAVIQLTQEEGEEPRTFVPAELGNSDEVKLGEKILIIGTPQDIDLAGSVSQGIISGVNRSLTSATTHYTGLIQVDAAINPGNSGGALINSFGQVIGINSAKYIDVSSEGLGFAISINSAKPIIDELIREGKITSRVCLGFTAYEVTEEMARRDRMPMGLYVESLRRGSDLINKGVLEGDVITEIDGAPVTTFEEVKTAIEGKLAGEVVTIKLNRYNVETNEDEDMEFTVTLMQDIDETTDYSEMFPDDGSDDETSRPDIPPEVENLSSKIECRAM